MDIPIRLKSTYLDRMTDDEFFHFCQEQRDLRIERNANLEVVIMSPTGGITGNWESEINALLRNWNRAKRLGKVFGSSTAFLLPDKSCWAPDASWVRKDKWNQLSKEDKIKFPPIAPDFIIEIRSSSDSLHRLQTKMKGWIKNGVQLAWMIDPWDLQCEIYRADGTVSSYKGFAQFLSGEGVLADFTLDLQELKAELED